MYFPIKMLDILVGIAKLLTGASGEWVGCKPEKKQRVYFANHTSNLDTIVIWSALPPFLRKITRPVAAKDYWSKPGIRQHIATKELNVVFVERNKEDRTEDPLNPLREALKEGSSLIIFPEGKRNSEAIPNEFKAGIYYLKKEFPEVEFVPVYLKNVAKTFPRGAPLPLPIICTAFFGKPLEVEIIETDDKMENKKNRVKFINQARQKVIELIPSYLIDSIPNAEKKIKDGEIKVEV
jgi:1-acyl-sn-glycerol-3-phosphate acyltransferase